MSKRKCNYDNYTTLVIDWPASNPAMLGLFIRYLANYPEKYGALRMERPPPKGSESEKLLKVLLALICVQRLESKSCDVLTWVARHYLSRRAESLRRGVQTGIREKKEQTEVRVCSRNNSRVHLDVNMLVGMPFRGVLLPFNSIDGATNAPTSLSTMGRYRYTWRKQHEPERGYPCRHFCCIKMLSWWFGREFRVPPEVFQQIMRHLTWKDVVNSVKLPNLVFY